MKKSLIISLSTLTILCGCSANSTSISAENKNPLTASRYEQELADTLANFIIQKEKFTEEPGVTEKLQKNISEAKERMATVDDTLTEGMQGALISMKVPVSGYALLLGKKLYLSSDFETRPGIDLHIYLTEEVDPRDTEFPDPTAVDLGRIQSVYGAQVYNVTSGAKDGALRTIVLWDKELNLLYSFGQLSN